MITIIIICIAVGLLCELNKQTALAKEAQEKLDEIEYSNYTGNMEDYHE